MRRVVVGVILSVVLAACTLPVLISNQPSMVELTSPPTPTQTVGQLEPTPSPTPLPPIATPTPLPPTPTPTPRPSPTPTPVPPTPTPRPYTGGPDTDPRWAEAINTTDGAAMGQVVTDILNIRSEPRLDASVVSTTYNRHPIHVYEIVEGDPIDGISEWYRVGEGQYVAAVYVEPLIPSAPVASYEGTWVDVNLTDFYAVAYQGDTPIYAAIIIAGRQGKTPVGEFTIFRRVPNDTMDSATVGIPKGHPEYYYLENVEFAQYFTGAGDALHTNYWSHPSAYGTNASNGCVNLMRADAAWFWDFLDIGSQVSVHH